MNERRMQMKKNKLSAFVLMLGAVLIITLPGAVFSRSSYTGTNTQGTFYKTLPSGIAGYSDHRHRYYRRNYERYDYDRDGRHERHEHNEHGNRYRGNHERNNRRHR
jgi:hypothetical protein